ncbi:hypothetical protein B9Z37_02225 [Limnohabitans parvus II-B4]|uniref:Aldehyde dehydrogenase domain-containing protein n=1 Tax=Limnohabitans parvus II-B4 TaxID=1293052 RepID=A0A315FQ85_9BURK|nr:hypothetical protein B9Z37_02225 [Limnohabitans parvus II-B4]
MFDPSDGQVFEQIPRSQAADIDQAAQAARAAFNGPWGFGCWQRLRGQTRRRRVPEPDPRGAGGGVELPFGGVKSSGYGRENGFEALLGSTTLKTVAMAHG